MNATLCAVGSWEVEQKETNGAKLSHWDNRPSRGFLLKDLYFTLWAQLSELGNFLYLLKEGRSWDAYSPSETWPWGSREL